MEKKLDIRKTKKDIVIENLSKIERKNVNKKYIDPEKQESTLRYKQKYNSHRDEIYVYSIICMKIVDPMQLYNIIAAIINTVRNKSVVAMSSYNDKWKISLFQGN